MTVQPLQAARLRLARPALLTTASRLISVCANLLAIQPATDDFRTELQGVLAEAGVA